MLVVFVQRPDNGGEPLAILPGDLAQKGDALVATTASGPFLPLAEAIDAEPALRDRLARALAPRVVARYRIARPWLLLGLLPIAALLELERQLASAGVSGIAGRLVGDLLIGAFCTLEIARPLPRHPRACAVALASIAARYAYMIAASCGHTLPLFWIGLTGALVGAVAMLVWMPTPRRVGRELREALSLPPTPTPTPSPSPSPTPSPSPSPSPSPFLALAAAAALPLALVGARRAGLGTWGTAMVFVGLGGSLPLLFRGRFRLPPARRASAVRTADAAFFGFATALSLARLLHYATNGSAEVAHCIAPSFYDRWLAPLADARAEGARTGGDSRLALAAMVVLVVPFVEERLYRHVLQRALRARTSETQAIAATSALFGLAHLGVYRTAALQTVLLGVGFGAAYEEAGLLAALLAHVFYNASQLF